MVKYKPQWRPLPDGIQIYKDCKTFTDLIKEIALDYGMGWSGKETLSIWQLNTRERAQ